MNEHAVLTPTKTPPIDLELQLMGKELAELLETVMALHSRLTPMLSEPPPDKDVEPIDKSETRAISRVTANLKSNNNDIRHAANMLKEIISRLEI